MNQPVTGYIIVYPHADPEVDNNLYLHLDGGHAFAMPSLARATVFENRAGADSALRARPHSIGQHSKGRTGEVRSLTMGVGDPRQATRPSARRNEFVAWVVEYDDGDPHPWYLVEDASLDSGWTTTLLPEDATRYQMDHMADSAVERYPIFDHAAGVKVKLMAKPQYVIER